LEDVMCFNQGSIQELSGGTE